MLGSKSLGDEGFEGDALQRFPKAKLPEVVIWQSLQSLRASKPHPSLFHGSLAPPTVSQCRPSWRVFNNTPTWALLSQNLSQMLSLDLRCGAQLYGTRLEHELLSQTFRAPPGYPGQIPGYPSKKFGFPRFRRTYWIFWPPPLHVADPHPTGRYPNQKVWVWVPFSALKLQYC